MITRVLLALLLTVGVEVPVGAFVFRSEWLRMGLACGLATTVTNLAMNLWLLRAGSSYWSGLLGWEAAAVVAEAAVYALVSKKHDIPRAMLASGLANAASFVAAAVLR